MNLLVSKKTATSQSDDITIDKNQESLWKEGIRKIKEIIGDDYVVTDPSSLDKLSKVIIPKSEKPSAFLYPGSVEEVQKIVSVANLFKLPLWPVSKGKNWGYGSATPVKYGSLIVVLERLNQIISLDKELAYVVIEPGVTYRQLHGYLTENDTQLWLDCTDGPADASVIGNALERGIGETPYGDHFENICGMEVILPTGELIRTGGGPMENYQSWNVHKWGVGPYLEGLFSQSNYGIVTKVGMWLMPKPPEFVSCLFELKREKDFPLLINALRRLQFSGAIVSKVHIVNDFINFAVVDKYPHHLLNGEKCLTQKMQYELRKIYNIAPWTFAAGIYGTKSQVKAHKKIVTKELKALGKIQFVDDRKIEFIKTVTSGLKKIAATRFLSGLARKLSMLIFQKPLSIIEFLPHVHDIEKGIPSDYFVKHAYYKSRNPKPADHDINPARDNIGLIWQGPLVPLDGNQVADLLDLCRPLYEKYQFEFSTSLMIANHRSLIALMSIFFDKDDAEETARAEALYYEMGKVTQDAGYQQYRTSVSFMDRIFDPAPEFKQLADKLKAVLDPNNIMAPGKYNIDR